MRVKRVVTHDGSHYGIRFRCPGCGDEHVIPTKPHERGWEFNGDMDRPTLSPSILVHPARHVDDQGGVIEILRCHSFVRDGQISFCSDSAHALAGKTIDLPDIGNDAE